MDCKSLCNCFVIFCLHLLIKSLRDFMQRDLSAWADFAAPVKGISYTITYFAMTDPRSKLRGITPASPCQAGGIE
jgi:hypothetical protein